MTVGSPVVSRRWLGLELRRLRRQRGLTQKQVGARCGWSGARLSYLENGQQNIVEDDLDQLLELYEVPLDQRARYYETAIEARSKGWWEAYSDIAPDYFLPFVGLEQGAVQIRSFQLMGVPGQLQTPEYAAGLLRHGTHRRTDRTTSRMVEMRMKRQQVVLRSEDPATLTAVIDESVLHRPPAGERQILTDQIRHLIDMAGRPNIALHVLPFERSVPELAYGSFVILTLALQDPDPDLVYVERRDGALYLEEFSQIESYLLDFDSLVDLSLSHGDSLAMMREILERQ